MLGIGNPSKRRGKLYLILIPKWPKPRQRPAKVWRAFVCYKRPSGGPAKLTKTLRRELEKLIEQGAEAAGYDCGLCPLDTRLDSNPI